ncbi:hypothetical protein WJX84_009770 [Apatococcus fuscideae]|uniref:GPI inositol-deacylase n=1 Tax=Apatococcus fuscideae TaxID=2026836 RepID=A0AAW1S065_9CHLO
MDSPIVILLPGLMRTKWSMLRIARHIKKELQLEAYCLAYPGRVSLLAAAEQTAHHVQKLAKGREVIAVVHSMGGIILRYMMMLPNQGGIQWRSSLLLAVPNHGSALAKRISDSTVLRAGMQVLCGKAACRALVPDHETLTTWPLPPQPCAVIAGTRSFEWFNPECWIAKMLNALPGPSDGTVLVEEARLQEADMAGFATVPVGHTVIMDDPAVLAMAIAFIKTSSLAMGPSFNHDQRYDALLVGTPHEQGKKEYGSQGMSTLAEGALSEPKTHQSKGAILCKGSHLSASLVQF